jgi:hypothetical protein
LLLLLVLVVGIGITRFDVSGRCEEQAEWLESKVQDRFARDPDCSCPATSDAPVRVQVTGSVPSDELREAALKTVRGIGAPTNP